MDSARLDALVTWIGQHPIAAGLVIFLIAFGDALVIVGVAIPAVPLLFARVLGQNTCDVTAEAIGKFIGPSGYGIVGLDYVSMGGSSKIDSWDSSAGLYSAAAAHTKGSVATNGSITLGGGAQIKGDARPGVSGSVNNPGNVTGSTARLTSALSYGPATLGSVVTYAVHPPTATHRQLDDEQLLASGIPPGLVRISVGLEDIEDLVADVERALGAAVEAGVGA